MPSPRAGLVVLGGSGLVGTRALQLWADEFTLLAPTHAQLNVLDTAALETFVRGTEATVVVNLAGWADVDGAEAERDNERGPVHGLNVAYPAHLARLCGELNKRLIHVSTDYVFDGTNTDRPYVEDDTTNPLSWYGITKRDGERRVIQCGAHVCVARIEMPFTAFDHRKKDFARVVGRGLSARQPVRCVSDQRITPVFLDDAIRALGRLVGEHHSGMIHVASADWTTPLEFARSIARRLDLDDDVLQARPFEDFASTRVARRPQHSWLDTTRFVTLHGHDVLRSVDAGLDAWAAQWLAGTPQSSPAIKSPEQAGFPHA